MTVTYTAEVATCTGLGCFLKLLRRWRGSIYKLVWLDLLLFITFYYCLNFTYRFLLNEEQRTLFEKVVKYCNDYSDLIPISFVLGFYVSIVMTRWWNQYAAIPFPDPIAVFVSATIHGNDERGRVMRRTIMRYVCLCVTMMFTMISPRVKKRFPTLDHFVEAGLLQNNEKDIIADLNTKFPKYSKHWLPIVWASSIVTRARKEGLIRDDFAVKTIIDELNKFRGQCGLLINYDNISIPLVYTQVVTLAVYSYFMTCLMAHQWVVHNPNSYTFDLYFPIFTVLQFFFYMGWLKVAESLINPFGDDDDDFEVNWMIDRNLQVSYLIVDEMHHEHPELVRDQYWDEVFPPELPYTLASEPFRESHPLPSTANIVVNPTDQELSQPTLNSVKCGDDMQSYSDMITFTAKDGGGRKLSLKRAGSSQASNIGGGGTSVPDSMSRVASVTSMVKKFFNRENSRTDPSASRRGSQVELNNLPPNLLQSSGSISTKTPVNTMKITDQIIEEVDEQLTITSLHSKQDTHRSIIGLFGPPPPSQPVPIPSSYVHAQNQTSQETEQTGTSANSQRLSVGSKDNVDTISIGCSETDEDGEEDEFTRLKNSRKEERRSRLRLSLARSISHNPTEMEMEYLLLLNQNRRDSDGESSPPVKQPPAQRLTPPSAHTQQDLNRRQSFFSPEIVRQVLEEQQRQAEQIGENTRLFMRSLSGNNGSNQEEGRLAVSQDKLGKSDSHLSRKGS